MRSGRRRGDPRVLLPQRPGGGVARVGERRLAGLDQRGVELREGGDREEDLAAHLEQLRHRDVGPSQPAGHVGDGADVGGDVLAGAPVAAGRRADQPAVLVDAG